MPSKHLLVDAADIPKIAALARLSPADEAMPQLAKQIESLLKYFEVLSELDTSNVEPTAHIADLQCPLRADALAEGLTRDEVLGRAPAATDEHFVVPKVIG